MKVNVKRVANSDTKRKTIATSARTGAASTDIV